MCLCMYDLGGLKKMPPLTYSPSFHFLVHKSHVYIYNSHSVNIKNINEESGPKISFICKPPIDLRLNILNLFYEPCCWFAMIRDTWCGLVEFLLETSDNTQGKLLSARRKRYDRSIMATGVDRPLRSVMQAAYLPTFLLHGAESFLRS